MQIIAPALTPDNVADIERLKELAVELYAELDTSEFINQKQIKR